MDIEAKIKKLESDIRMKEHFMLIDITPPENDIVFKSSLREQVKHMKQEVELLKQLREASDE